jgi:HAD superfamily hydrolase (TIGR01548 family)
MGKNTNGDCPKRTYRTLLVDMDGVLAEVSKSYRIAIEKTCHSYGATSVTQQTISDAKAAGNANDDWKLSHRLILADPGGQQDVTLEQVTDTFEKFYQGDGTTPGLYTLESLIPSRETLLELRKRSRPGMGIVTGRPRKDCMMFLKLHDLTDLFGAVYCMEDGPGKPDPFPVVRACELLGVEPSGSVVLLGDTPDDVAAAVAAGCRAAAVVTPEVVKACRAAGTDPSESTMAAAMRERGADVILAPGFAELVDMFEQREVLN